MSRPGHVLGLALLLLTSCTDANGDVEGNPGDTDVATDAADAAADDPSEFPETGDDPDAVGAEDVAADAPPGDTPPDAIDTADMGAETEDVPSDPPRQDLLLVYADGNPESEALAAYYADPATGRDIDPAMMLGIAVPAASTVDRDTYETAIRTPIADWIQASGRRNEIKYIVLFKGVPHRISGTGEFDPMASTFSSVDSELCTLFSAGLYPVEGWLFNGPRYNDYIGGGGFYLGADTEFRHQRFTVSSRDRRFNLDYLVGRIDAYSYDDARGMIDRAKAASTTGWVVLDTSPGRRGLDTMVDPVWPQTDDSADSAEERLRAAGLGVVSDTSNATLVGDPAEALPDGAVESVIAYAGWGVNHGGDGYPGGALYIRDDLQFTWLPGAAWLSYESFNGTVLDGALLDAEPGARRGQGQVGDFLARGGTVAIGNAWEPFASAVGHEAHIFERYLVHGDPWIEAAYKGLRYLSWQEVVLGDPLCTLPTP